MDIPKLDFPNEEVLKFIEDNHSISVARNGFASREYYNITHPEGKKTPTFSANSGIGDGKPVVLVDLDGITYVVLNASKAQKGPIRRHRSSNRGQ